MLFENERFWDTKNRLENWKGNQYTSENETAAIRLEETKKRKSKTQAAAPAEEQKKASAEREAENLKREQEHEENKKKAVSFEEYQKGKKQGGALDRLKNISSTPKK